MSESILAPRQARQRLIHRAGKRLNGTTTFHKREHDTMTAEKSISKTMKAVRSLSNHKEYKLQNLGPLVGNPASYLEAPSSNLRPHSRCKFSCCYWTMRIPTECMRWGNDNFHSFFQFIIHRSIRHSMLQGRYFKWQLPSVTWRMSEQSRQEWRKLFEEFKCHPRINVAAPIKL